MEQLEIFLIIFIVLGIFVSLFFIFRHRFFKLNPVHHYYMMRDELTLNQQKQREESKSDEGELASGDGSDDFSISSFSAVVMLIVGVGVATIVLMLVGASVPYDDFDVTSEMFKEMAVASSYLPWFVVVISFAFIISLMISLVLNLGLGSDDGEETKSKKRFIDKVKSRLKKKSFKDRR